MEDFILKISCFVVVFYLKLLKMKQISVQTHKTSHARTNQAPLQPLAPPPPANHQIFVKKKRKIKKNSVNVNNN